MPSDTPPLTFREVHIPAGDQPLPDPRLQGNSSVSPASEAALLEMRQRALGQASSSALSASAALEAQAAAEAAAFVPREDIESVEVAIPNGSVVLFGPPAVPASIRLAQMLGPQASNLLISIVSQLLYVRAINGAPVVPVSDIITAQALLNRIGDDGLDVLNAVSAECWPAVNRQALPIIKKIFRR